MPNIGALWAEMRVGGGWSSCFCGENQKVPGYFLQVGGGVGGGQAVFVAKIIKYQGTFCRWVGGWVGVCSENSLFSESTLKKRIRYFRKVPPPLVLRTCALAFLLNLLLLELVRILHLRIPKIPLFQKPN